MRPEANRELFYKKDMGILARSGFSYDISKKILSMSQKEFNDTTLTFLHFFQKEEIFL